MFKGPSCDKKLEKSRKQSDEARGKIIRMQSMLNRIERFELGEADFLDPSGDFLRGQDIFVDLEDRDLFKEACPTAFDRIERRETVVHKEEEKKLARKTSALLLEKLTTKLEPAKCANLVKRMKERTVTTAFNTWQRNTRPSSSTPVVDAKADAAHKKKTRAKEERKHQLMRALDDRKAYMIEALQMQIALMINQHPITDDYQSPVNGSMYSQLPHRCAILHCPVCITHTDLPPPPAPLLPHPSV